MAGPQKRRAVRKESSDSSPENSEVDSYNGQEEIQADFEGRNPEGQDFHGIKQLLQQVFLKAHVDLSQLADMLIAQTGIGSVLKQSTYDDEDEDEDDMSAASDVFGITTVLNLSSHKETPCVQEIISLVSELSTQHADQSVQQEIESILKQSKKFGLLINERFINIPPKISDPLLTSLMTEIDRMKKKDPSYDFDYLLMICKLHKPRGDKGDILFSNAEEEMFDKEAKVSFEFNVTSESDTTVGGKWTEDDIEMVPYRRILFIDGKKFNDIVQQVKIYVA